MEERLKQRLVGAAVLVLAAVVFVPILLDGPDEQPGKAPVTAIQEIPERPAQRFEPTTGTALEPPRTPRLDAEVERERDRQASDASSAQREVLADTPARVSLPAVVEESAPAAVPAPIPSDAPASGSASIRSEAPAVVPAPDPSEPPARRPAEGAQEKPPALAPAGGAGGWIVQLGSFRKAENARALRGRLRAQGYPAFVESGTSARGELSRVFVGPMADRAQAKESAARLQREMKLEGIVLRYPGR